MLDVIDHVLNELLAEEAASVAAASACDVMPRGHLEIWRLVNDGEGLAGDGVDAGAQRRRGEGSNGKEIHGVV